MTFVSLTFFLFVAAVTLVYFIVPKRFQWIVLLAGSYLFYWINSEWLVLVLFAATVITFLTGKAIYRVRTAAPQGELTPAEMKAHKANKKKRSKRILLVGVLLDLGMLVFLKYYNFLAGNANQLLKNIGIEAPALNLLLPLGISFYTLQALAYMIDIYRGKLEPDQNLGKFMLFMSFFPQIVQGPIPRHHQLAEQLYAEHKFDYTRLTYGVQLMLWGLFKKLVIADRIAAPVDKIFGSSANYHGLIVFFGAICYGIQIYTDFSGGMDVARGVAQIFGIELELNFRQPFFARSIEEFWRRWHITLGGWMRDYVFYPLSLSKLFANLSKKARKLFGPSVGKKIPPLLSMFIVYLLVGIWHGSSWKYVAYGLWNGAFIMAGILWGEFYEKARDRLGIEAESVSWRLFQGFRTFMICCFGRIFARGDGLGSALQMMRSIFVSIADLSFLTNGSLTKLGLNTANWVLLIFAVGLLLYVDSLHEKEIHIRETLSRQHLIFRWAVYYCAIFAVLIFGVWGPVYDAQSFIYEQF